MKRGRKILLWVVGVPIALYAIAYAARFQTTPPIEGVLVDAKTGKPVDKAFIRAGWHMSYSAIVDTVGGGFSYETVTDEDGRFRIPRRNVTVVFGRFDDQSLRIWHPLYEFVDKQVYVQSYKKYRVGTLEEGVLRLTMPMMSLEDKYSKPEDLSALARVIGSCGPEFYVSMRDDFGVRYDLERIMAELGRIAARFRGADYRVNDAYSAYLYHEIVMKELRKTY